LGLPANDEDRGPAISVTRRAAALLAAELLAGAGDIRTLTGGAGGAAALLELPGDDAVQDVGARLNGENLVLELDVAAGLAAVEVLNLDLHDLAFLAFVGPAVRPRPSCLQQRSPRRRLPRPHGRQPQPRRPLLPRPPGGPGFRGGRVPGPCRPGLR